MKLEKNPRLKIHNTSKFEIQRAYIYYEKETETFIQILYLISIISLSPLNYLTPKLVLGTKCFSLWIIFDTQETEIPFPVMAEWLLLGKTF